VKMELSRKLIESGKLDEAKEGLEIGKQKLDNSIGILEPVIHSYYYKAALEHHKSKNNASDFYRNSLLYLTYTPLNSIPAQEQVQLAYDVGLAALLGHDIYQFGELLQQPVAKALIGTEHEWLSQLLYAFNSGDINTFKTIYAQKAPHLDVLSSSAAKLNQKIRIMSLMELVFKRPPNQRRIEFTEISTTCDLPVDQVEWLLMKAFADGVVLGLIDQVDQFVRIAWVQPRVLNLGQISQLKEKLVVWSKQVQQTAVYLEENAAQIL